MWQLIKKVIRFFLLFTLIWVLTYRFINPPLTSLMVLRLFESKKQNQKHRLYKNWVPINKINSSLQLAVIASEDQQFEKHLGFDLNSIQKAYKSNTKKKPLRGGSTITQQVAKNVFLWPGRSYFRKAIEVYFTFLIEVFWSKKRIMEVYLNVIEMGNGVYGAEAASEYYFKTTASRLNSSQAAAIAAILPNPRIYQITNPQSFVTRKKNWILKQMRNIEKPAWLLKN